MLRTKRKPDPKIGPLGGGYCFRSRLMLVGFASLTDVGQGVVLRCDVAIVEPAARIVGCVLLRAHGRTCIRGLAGIVYRTEDIQRSVMHDALVQAVVLRGAYSLSEKRVGDRVGEVHGDRETEIGVSDDRAAAGRNGGDRRDFVFHGRLLVKHSEVDSVEVDGLRAVEVLVLFHSRRDFSVRSVHVSGDGEFTIGDDADRSRYGGCALQVFFHDWRGSSQSVLNYGAGDLGGSFVEKEQERSSLGRVAVVI